MHKNPTPRHRRAAEFMRIPGMTQTKLAGLFGVTSQAISQRLKAYREATSNRYEAALQRPGKKIKMYPKSLSFIENV